MNLGQLALQFQYYCTTKKKNVLMKTRKPKGKTKVAFDIVVNGEKKGDEPTIPNFEIDIIAIDLDAMINFGSAVG